MDELDPFYMPARVPTAQRPLLGLTVLVVEDSRFASEALRLLCLRSGARIRRADCLKSARRHLQVYRPAVALIDIGLQDGGGDELIRELVAHSPRAIIVIGMSADLDAEFTALDAGADGFLAKPIISLPVFQHTILQHLPIERRPRGLRGITQETVEPDRLAYQDDLAHIIEILRKSQDTGTLDYATQFLAGIACSAEDDALHAAATEAQNINKSSTRYGAHVEKLTGLVHERLEKKVAF
jgi:CheY-like chemotaxis protein